MRNQDKSASEVYLQESKLIFSPVPLRVPLDGDKLTFCMPITRIRPGGLGLILGSLTLVLTCSFSSPLEAQGDDRPLQERLLREAPKKWKDYRAFAAQIQGTFSIVIEKARSPERPEIVRGEIKQNKSCALEQISERSSTEVYAVNADYGFALQGSKATSTWVLIGIERDNKDNIKIEDRKVPDAVSYYTTMLLSAYGHPVDTLVMNPGFKIKAVQRVQRNGVDLAEVTFDLLHEDKEQPFDPVRAGIIWFDPDDYWCVREFQVQCVGNDAESTLHGTNDLKHIGDYPVITKTVYVDTEKGKTTPFQKMTYEFDFDHPTNLPPDDEFKLSAFGLPEPFGAKSSRPRWYLWAAIGGLACVVGGALIRRYCLRAS